MGNWWIDEEPYPGPKEKPSLTLSELKELYASIGVSFTHGFGKFSRACKEFSEHFTSAWMDHTTFPPPKPPPPSTREELLARKKNVQHGPYGGGFDRKGRKF